MAHPDLDTRISASKDLANFTTDGVDLAIRNSSSFKPGLWSRKLLDIHLLPVASPRLIAEIGGLRTPADLIGVPLIHDTMLGALSGMPTWSEWLESAGVTGVDLSRGLRFNSSDHALEAAGEGAGVLLGQRELAHDDLRSGRLVAPFAHILPADRNFAIVCPDGLEKRPKVRAFIDWIMDEVTRMRRETEELNLPGSRDLHGVTPGADAR